AHPHVGIRKFATGAILERWTAIDPRDAFENAGRIIAKPDDDDPFRLGHQVRGDVLRRWAHTDPAAALAAGGREFEDEIRQGIMESNPDHALAKWRAIAPDRPFPVSMLEYALRGQVRRDPQGAVAQVPD